MKAALVLSLYLSQIRFRRQPCYLTILYSKGSVWRGQGCPQSYKCRVKKKQRIRKRKGILRGQKDRSSSRDPPTGKSHRAGSTSQHGFSKQCLLPSTHTPGAEFQVLNLDNTAGIPAVLLHHTWDFRQLSVKNICKEYSLHFSHDNNENEYLQSRASQVAQWSRTHLSVQRIQVPSLCGEGPWEEGMASHSSILA